MPDVDRSGNKEKIEGMKKVYPTLINYSIKEIDISENKARVKVLITVILDDKKTESEHYDYWSFKNNEWYLVDFGKIQ